MANRSKAPLQIRECWLFAISSKKDLARRLSTEKSMVTVADLERLAADKGNFRLFTIRQGLKGRDVQEPKRDLQRLHSRIHKLLSRVQVPEYLHSAVKGKSYLTNARAHDLDVPLIKIDVKKFFPSVSRRAVYKFLVEVMQCRRDVAGLLAEMLTYNSRLPTGSSSSPIIAYYAFKPMFDEIAAVSAQHGLKMTCYVDDITLSGENASRKVLNEIRHIIAKNGLQSHKMKLFSAAQAKVITGVCNTPVGERVPNRLHFKIHEGFKRLTAPNSASEVTKILQQLLGRMEAARQIDPVFGHRARTLRAQMKAGSR